VEQCAPGQPESVGGPPCSPELLARTRQGTLVPTERASAARYDRRHPDEGGERTRLSPHHGVFSHPQLTSVTLIIYSETNVTTSS
jgi:hypothetical protein